MGKLSRMKYMCCRRRNRHRQYDKLPSPSKPICLLFALMSQVFQVSSLFCLPINPSVFFNTCYFMDSFRIFEKEKFSPRCQPKKEDQD